MNILFLLLFLFSCSVSDEQEVKEQFEKIALIEEVDIHPSRCSYEDCLCEVRIPSYTPQFSQKKIQTWTSVFFVENKSEIDEYHQKHLSEFVYKNINSETLFVIGYTDGCGKSDYNKFLSKKRADETTLQIRKLGYKNRVITYGMSEFTNNHSDFAKRSDIISIKNLKIEVPPPNLTADFYLLDASQSIKDYYFWVNVIAANKNSNSKMYISHTKSCIDGTYANRITPTGGTEIWWSYWQLLDKMKSGQSLLIMSDFNSRYPLSIQESNLLIQKAQKRGIKVYGIKI